MKWLLAMAGILVAGAQAQPGARAEKIALAQARVTKNFAELKREAKRIGDRNLREVTASMLEKPRFDVVAARRGAEKEIAERLQAEGLRKDTGPLFPKEAPIAFIAAPGGTSTGHHAYPGGLVYHTLFNLRSGIAYVHNYRFVYGIAVDEDLVRAAAIWHDVAKTFTLPWKEDGTLPAEEPQIAGTAAHHIWGIAEALNRKLPPKFIVALASAHEAPWGEGEKKVCAFLRAAARIAGVDFAAAGLRTDGEALAGDWEKRPPLEAFITHFDDGDFPLTITSLQSIPANGDPWKRAEKLAAQGDLALYGQKQ